jgi:hypothetical protein
MRAGSQRRRYSSSVLPTALRVFRLLIELTLFFGGVRRGGENLNFRLMVGAPPRSVTLHAAPGARDDSIVSSRHLRVGSRRGRSNEAARSGFVGWPIGRFAEDVACRCAGRSSEPSHLVLPPWRSASPGRSRPERRGGWVPWISWLGRRAAFLMPSWRGYDELGWPKVGGAKNSPRRYAAGARVQ